jgi:hypothetical protein
VPKIADIVALAGKDWQPGPGKYSPANNFGRNTSPDSTSVSKDSIYTVKDFGISQAKSTKARSIGKNAPLKVEFFPKKKTVPSIPAKSLAPPEDKLAAQTDGIIEKSVKKEPLPSYMTEFEGQRNPIVGPFSYSPHLIGKNIHN